MANYRYKRRASRSKFEPAGAWKPNKASWKPSAGRPDYTRHTAIPVRSRQSIPLSRGLPSGAKTLGKRRNSNAAAGAALAAGGVAAAVAFSRSKTGKKMRRKMSNKMHHRGSSAKRRSGKSRGGGTKGRQRRDSHGKFA